MTVVSLHGYNERGYVSYYRFTANDISRGSFAIAKVRTTLAGAFAMLTSTAYQRKEEISARRDRRHYPLHGKKDPESMSILSTVMGVTQEVSVSHVAES